MDPRELPVEIEIQALMEGGDIEALINLYRSDPYHYNDLFNDPYVLNGLTETLNHPWI